MRATKAPRTTKRPVVAANLPAPWMDEALELDPELEEVPVPDDEAAVLPEAAEWVLPLLDVPVAEVAPDVVAEPKSSAEEKVWQLEVEGTTGVQGRVLSAGRDAGWDQVRAVIRKARG